ncbi:MAG: hypothetical protein ABSF45_11080 [Terriglobia bacterium]
MTEHLIDRAWRDLHEKRRFNGYAGARQNRDGADHKLAPRLVSPGRFLLHRNQAGLILLSILKQDRTFASQRSPRNRQPEFHIHFAGEVRTFELNVPLKDALVPQPLDTLCDTDPSCPPHGLHSRDAIPIDPSRLSPVPKGRERIPSQYDLQCAGGKAPRWRKIERHFFPVGLGPVRGVDQYKGEGGTEVDAVCLHNHLGAPAP